MTTTKSSPSLGRLPLEPWTLDIMLRGSTDRTGRLARFIEGDTTAFATLTVGDLLYDAARLDPVAIAGFDFARAADLSDVFQLAGLAERISWLGSASHAGDLAQLQGYVAECTVAHALRAEGAEVSFPARPNEPGWDLLVNGDRFQVKCLESPGAVHDHLARYPDIPVIVNHEIGGSFIDDDRVTPLHALRHAEVVAQTRGTLDAAADLFDLRTPLFVGIIGTARASVAILRSQSDLRTASRSAAFTAAAGGGGGLAGAALTALGVASLGVTGGWIAIIAPVFGSIAGYRAGGGMADGVKRHLLCGVEAGALAAAIKSFAGAACRVSDGMIASSQRFRATVAALETDGRGFGAKLAKDWLKRVDFELSARTYYRRRMAAAAVEPRTIEPSSNDLRVHAAQTMWTASRAGILPTNLPIETRELKARVSDYDAALRRWLLR